jgi:alpha-galactosidase
MSWRTKLKAHGWQYVVVDIQWYEPNAKSFDYRKDAKVVRMNSAGSGRRRIGFRRRRRASVSRRLADYVHGKGLKFGIHLMRGIPRQAVRGEYAVKGHELPRARHREYEQHLRMESRHVRRGHDQAGRAGVLRFRV